VSNTITGRNYNLPDAIIRQGEKINSGNKTPVTKDRTHNGQSFQEILNQKLDSQISFSKHANQRAEQRNIVISEGDLTKLGDACNKAREKGIRDALIVMKDSAFIVNAPNKVVITVVDKKEMEDNVITNIDGAVFL
jgi:flagellar operon protein